MDIFVHMIEKNFSNEDPGQARGHRSEIAGDEERVSESERDDMVDVATRMADQLLILD